MNKYMKTKRYKGIFKNAEDHVYELEVDCFNFLQAFFLLTTEAIKSARHYQLYSITDEKGNVKMVDDITKCNLLLID